ncbi:uncharacterized protein LOC117788102 [Drosophila innubila]|uniref:uncharacterized protein LOC117788102 n=1 Tax=Drosophila innubila TaxID=198719 RepID=UPI00148BA75C|nr:uncharacterized protein LOC117788102 [Drosophila innubila]
MAIPFYEDEPATAASSLEPGQIADGDQVDGPAYASDAGYDQVDYEAPSGAATSNSQATSTLEQTAPSTEQQLLAWKMLALAMCKVLKQFYLQQQQKGKSAKLTATVQIQPQAQ